jgi:hypothetical protein
MARPQQAHEHASVVNFVCTAVANTGWCRGDQVLAWPKLPEHECVERFGQPGKTLADCM